MKATIQPLKKVTLSLTVGGKPEKSDLAGPPAILEFIFGIASDGLCPFESALYDKQEGDNLSLNVPAVGAHEFFGHVFQPLRQLLNLQILPETISLNIEVAAVVAADNREVVQSLAKALSQGSCGGSCGCGCS